MSSEVEAPHRAVRAINGCFGCLLGTVSLVIFASAGCGIVEVIRTEAWYQSLWIVPMLLLGAPFVGLFLGIPPASGFWATAMLAGLMGGASLGWSLYRWPGGIAGSLIGAFLGHMVGAIPTFLLVVFLPAGSVTPLLPDPESTAEVADGPPPAE